MVIRGKVGARNLWELGFDGFEPSAGTKGGSM